jgi:hypothetical protein
MVVTDSITLKNGQKDSHMVDTKKIPQTADISIAFFSISANKT